MSANEPYVELRLTDPGTVDRLMEERGRLIGGEPNVAVSIDALISSLLDRADERRRLANYIGLPWDASEGEIRNKIAPVRSVIDLVDLKGRQS